MPRRFKFQLIDSVTGDTIGGTGGMAQACAVGTPDRVAISATATGTLAVTNNPIALTQGSIEFFTDDTVANVDLYIMAPTGHFVTLRNIRSSGPNEVFINTAVRQQIAAIPFSIADAVAATERDTGFDLPVGAMVSPIGVGIDVSALNATRTIDFGILSSESGGDADGFGVALSVAALGTVKATVVGTDTLGALVKVDTNGSSVLVPEAYVVTAAAPSVSYTLSTGTTTAKGILIIPYLLSNYL